MQGPRGHLCRPGQRQDAGYRPDGRGPGQRYRGEKCPGRREDCPVPGKAGGQHCEDYCGQEQAGQPDREIKNHVEAQQILNEKRKGQIKQKSAT